MSRWHSCNVLSPGPETRELWQFVANNGHYDLVREHRAPAADNLPTKVITKDWRTLWQRKLNVAWLPLDKVFLRVVHLPANDPAEVLSMVELQLEKLSPLPVNQIVWSMEVLPQQAESLQTVVVVIAERSNVEEFLGGIEKQGFLADRLEIPHLDQLLGMRAEGDGAWIFPQAGGDETTCLVAWWYGGALRYLSFLRLPAGDQRARLLREQLTQMMWAGELDGWLTAAPRWFVAADESTAAEWVPALMQVSEQPVTFIQPEHGARLAALTAQRAASRADRATNLLPAEFATRYRQQFIDRLWMRGLGAFVMVYLAGVVLYFAALQYLDYRVTTVQGEIGRLSGSYTNALQLSAKVQVLQEQLNLKYAALDCWKAASENLPSDLALVQMIFSRGRLLRLQGTASEGQQQQIFDYNEAMRKAAGHDQTLFGKVSTPTIQSRVGSSVLTWAFECELKRAEAE